MNASRCAEELELNPKFTRELYAEIRKKLLGKDAFNGITASTTLYIQVSNGEIKIVPESQTDNSSNIKFIRCKNENGAYYYKLDYKNANQKSLLKIIERIDGLDIFYRYCQERLLNFRGRNTKAMIGLFQELAFRYNHRNEDFFKILINKLTY
jgi:hypothetical protein